MARSSEAVSAVDGAEPRLLQTPLGDARVWLHEPRGRARALLVVGHGAGRGADTADLLALAAELPRSGIAVARLDQPWVLAGRKVASPPAQLDVAWLAAVPLVQALLPSRVPLVVAGRSAGARVACRTAVALDASGVVALAFPLHPPGRPEKSRAAELLRAGAPTLVVQGGRDTFGGASEVRASVAGRTGAGSRTAEIEVVEVPYADHSFRVAAAAPVSAEQTLGLLVEAVRTWLLPRTGR